MNKDDMLYHVTNLRVLEVLAVVVDAADGEEDLAALGDDDVAVGDRPIAGAFSGKDLNIRSA